ncbi:hypothetical protein [Pigmentiphaga aceris]|uniref:hypothetical protein n=1 Tax=Pigmentiphaga aceris TaxID=1940612 RepID=UPI001FEA33BC|nr:hypothetical protein [Pigmentiphaga aceris]
METFAFDAASNLLDDNVNEIRCPQDQNPKRSQLLDNLLREYAGTHYEYDECGNQVLRWHDGAYSRLTWDLFDRCGTTPRKPNSSTPWPSTSATIWARHRNSLTRTAISPGARSTRHGVKNWV